MQANRRQVLIAGCGYVGQRLALQLQSRYDVTSLVRSAERAAELARLGVRALAIDLDRVRPGTTIPESLDLEAIVYLTPPPVLGESDLRLDRFLQLASVPPHTFVYMSTTGVYGDTAGAAVDESSVVQPRTDRARRLSQPVGLRTCGSPDDSTEHPGQATHHFSQEGSPLFLPLHRRTSAPRQGASTFSRCSHGVTHSGTTDAPD